MFLKFTDSCQKLLYLSLREKNKYNDDYIGSEHLFLALLKLKNNSICKVLYNNNITYESFSLNIVKKDNQKDYYSFVYTPVMKEIFLNLSKKKCDFVDIGDIVLEILNMPNSKVNLILKNMSVDISSVLKDIKVSYNKKSKYNKSILNEIGVCLNEKCSGDGEVLFGRKKELSEIIEILCCKNKNNPLLIGDAGVGKTAIIEELARMIEGSKVPRNLRNKKIYSISMASLVAGTKYRGEFEDKINRLINEVENADDVILFIDEIHTLVGAGGADGAIDASNILKPSLARGNIKIIGATTKEEYNKFFLDDKALNRRFRLINVDEPSIDETKDILMGIKPLYEKYHNVVVPDSIIDLLLDFSNRYFLNKKFPDKAIDLLDEVCVLSSFSFSSSYEKIDNLETEIKKVINNKNKSLLSNDYKSAIFFSSKEKELFSMLGNLQGKIINENSKNIVSDKVLFKVMERKTNIPFYSYKYDFDNIKNILNNYKRNSLFSKSIINKVNAFFYVFLDNLINNVYDNKLYVYSDNYHKNNYFIDECFKILFKGINRIDIDCVDVTNLDSLYNNKLIKTVKDNSFSIIVFNNYKNDCMFVNDFFKELLKHSYYISFDNEKVSFKNVLFIINKVNNDNKLGFYKNDNNDCCCIDVSTISKFKIKNKVMDYLNRNNINLCENSINTITNNICNNYMDFNNIDYYISKEYKILKNNKENRPIKV